MKKNVVALLVLALLVCQVYVGSAYTSPGKLFDQTVYGNQSGHNVATETKQDSGQQWRVKITDYNYLPPATNSTYFNIRNSSGTRMSKARLFFGTQDKTTSYTGTAKKGKPYTLTCEIKDSTIVGPPTENVTFGNGLWSP